MKCPLCEFEAGGHRALCHHVQEKHLVKDVRGGDFRVCWCGVTYWFVHGSSYDTNFCRHIEDHGGVERHFHDCMMGVNK